MIEHGTNDQTIIKNLTGTVNVLTEKIERQTEYVNQWKETETDKTIIQKFDRDRKCLKMTEKTER